MRTSGSDGPEHYHKPIPKFWNADRQEDLKTKRAAYKEKKDKQRAAMLCADVDSEDWWASILSPPDGKSGA